MDGYLLEGNATYGARLALPVAGRRLLFRVTFL